MLCNILTNARANQAQQAALGSMPTRSTSPTPDQAPQAHTMQHQVSADALQGGKLSSRYVHVDAFKRTHVLLCEFC
jgi:hypothetical protein